MLEKIKLIARHLIDSGATRVLQVGGGVRDKLLGLPIKDIDLEVYGLPIDKLVQSLEEIGKVDIVGKSFGVLKFHFKGDKANIIDISIPRRDSKGKGDRHKDIVVQGDPFLPLEEAFKRRDFTINAIGIDLITGDIIDIYGGQSDLKNRIIRAVDINSFTDDPLRVLRAMQFAGRFEFSIDKGTIELAQNVNLSDLSKERVRDEIFKLLLKANNPSIGFNAGLELKVIQKLFPQLYKMKNFPQNPVWHPEGCVWTHTMLTVDHAAKLGKDLDIPRKLALLLAALLHDVGKPFLPIDSNNKSIGHDKLSEQISASILEDIKIFSLEGFKLNEVVCKLVSNHMRPFYLWDKKEELTKRAWTRLRQDVMDEVELLILLDLADRLGRGKEFKENDEISIWLREQFKIEASPEIMKPIILGRHLIPLGYKQSPELGKELKRLYELQLQGKFSTLEEGLKLVKKPLPKIVLASSSPRRKMLLELLGVKFSIEKPQNVDEDSINILPFENYVQELAYLKANSIIDKLEDNSLIIGADTIVVFDNQILGKPKDKIDAFNILNALNNNWHEVYTGIAVINKEKEKIFKSYEKTKVKFKYLTEEEINAYIDTGEPMDKAGAYGLQGIGAIFVERIEGCYTNVIGLPLPLLDKILKEYFNYSILLNI